MSEIAFEESSRVNKSINDDFTVVKEYDLLFADGFNSNENAFRLQPLESKTQEFVPVVVPVLYGFAQNGKNYAVVQLDGANLIDNNLESVRYNGELLSPLEVVYNYATGEQMAVVTPDMITSGNFTVEVYKNDVVISDRAYWKQWTDAVYKIEKKGYAETVAGVFQRMFALAHHKIEMTVKQSVKFNDFISFDYKGRSDYPVLNCSWDVSNNESTVTIVKAFYRDNDLVDPGSENNILPIVDAGADIAMAGGQRDVSLGATAYDPDGYIVSFLWEIVSGGGGLISNPTSAVTNVTGLTGDDYVIRVTVTDNDGGVAFDEITLSRVLSYTVTLPLVNDQGNGANSIEVKEYRLFLDPALAANGIVKFSGTYSLRTNKKSNYNSAYAKFYIVKNGTRIFEKMVIDLGTENGSFEFNFIASDTIDIGLEGTARIDDPGYTSLKPETWASFVLANYEFVGGGGVVIGLPLEDQSMYIEGY